MQACKLQKFKLKFFMCQNNLFSILVIIVLEPLLNLFYLVSLLQKQKKTSSKSDSEDCNHHSNYWKAIKMLLVCFKHIKLINSFRKLIIAIRMNLDTCNSKISIFPE